MRHFTNSRILRRPTPKRAAEPALEDTSGPRIWDACPRDYERAFPRIVSDANFPSRGYALPELWRVQPIDRAQMRYSGALAVFRSAWACSPACWTRSEQRSFCWTSEASDRAEAAVHYVLAFGACSSPSSSTRTATERALTWGSREWWVCMGPGKPTATSATPRGKARDSMPTAAYRAAPAAAPPTNPAVAGHVWAARVLAVSAHPQSLPKTIWLRSVINRVRLVVLGDLDPEGHRESVTESKVEARSSPKQGSPRPSLQVRPSGDDGRRGPYPDPHWFWRDNSVRRYGAVCHTVLVTSLSGPLARFGRSGAVALGLWAERAGVALEVIDAYPSAAGTIAAAESARPDVVFGPYGSGPAVTAAAASIGVVWNHGGATARLGPTRLSAGRQLAVSGVLVSGGGTRHARRRRSPGGI